MTTRRVYFSVNGVLLMGNFVCRATPPEGQDPLLAELMWPPGSVVLADVRLATLNTPIARCMVVPAAAIHDSDGLEDLR